MNAVCVSVCSRASRRGHFGQGCGFFLFCFLKKNIIVTLSARKIKEHWEYVLDRACSYVITGYFLINSLAFYSKSTVTPCMTQRERASGKVRIAQASFILHNKYTWVPCIFKTGSRVDLEEFLSLRILRILYSIRLGPQCALSKTIPFSSPDFMKY